MQLFINNPDNLNLDNFCKFICLQMKLYFQDDSKQDKNLINVINNYLYNIYKNKLINYNNILNIYFDNLLYRKDNKNNYIITSNDNIKIDNIRIDSLVRLITNGTLSLPKYTIVEDIFKKVESMIDLLYIYWRYSHVN